MIETQKAPELAALREPLERFWTTAADKIRLLEKEYAEREGAPVFTANGRYTARGWTEWTQGFQYGMAILQYDATGDEAFLDLGRRKTVERMAQHLSHTGVHDHGFNNVSTYGNLRRLMLEGRIPHNEWELHFYELALKASGAVQATRWTKHATGGFIHSFNGPHSLFVDTIRSCRALMMSHLLGHVLMGEADERINLLERALQHIKSTADYSVFYGEGRDIYDLRGRTAHESIFNIVSGAFRCPGTQQGYSGFSTWTRGLSWAVCGFAEELEFLDTLGNEELEPFGGRAPWQDLMEKAARATADFFLLHTPADGIPYWDTGAPRLGELGPDFLEKPADPFNSAEPVDSSAAAITAQGLLRLANWLRKQGRDEEDAAKYEKAAHLVAATLFDEPYLSTGPQHQGLILHSIYHRPNGWDTIPAGATVPRGESSMWGDYHAMELALVLQRQLDERPYYAFFTPVKA